MLTIDDYDKICLFQTEMMKLQFAFKADYTFSQRVMDLLDSIFGYNHSIMAHLYAVEEPVLVPNFQLHNVDLSFAEKLFEENKRDPTLFRLPPESDAVLLSSDPNHVKSDFYKRTFRPNGYSDCILQFIKYPDSDSYMSYIMLFSIDPFTAKDLEILSALKTSISIAFSNALKLWNLQMRYSLLQKCIDYFPVGIMVIENMVNVTFANELAQEYLKELGVNNQEFYTTFYVNNIFQYHQYDVYNYVKRRPIRIKSFLFNVIPMGNEGAAFDHTVWVDKLKRQLSTKEIVSTFSNITACVYIIRDDTETTKGSQGFYDYLGLTKRERQVAMLIIDGLNNSEIAKQLVLSTNTVKIHVSNILRKAGALNRMEFVGQSYEYEDKH